MLQELEVTEKNLEHRMTLHHGFTKYHIRLDVYQTERTFPSVLRDRSGRQIKFRFERPSLDSGSNFPFHRKLGLRRPFGQWKCSSMSAGAAEVFEMGGSTPGGGAHTEQPLRQAPQTNSIRRWVKISSLKRFAFPSPHQKIVKDLVQNDR